jgi:hypothetical protein
MDSRVFGTIPSPLVFVVQKTGRSGCRRVSTLAAIVVGVVHATCKSVQAGTIQKFGFISLLHNKLKAKN